MKRFLIVAAGIVLFVTGLHAQAATPTSRGKTFWVGFMENITLFANGAPKFSFYISCDVNTNGIISLPATGFSQPFAATAGQITEVFLPTGIFYASGSESIANYGLLVTADDSIQLSVQHHRLYYSEASVILPYSELDDEYMVMTHPDDLTSGGLPEFVVIATEDNTVVDITPSVLTYGFHSAGVTFSITLNKGQSYQVQSYSDLTGSHIIARNNKPIAVFCGATYANVLCIANNHLYDQLHPLVHWGQEYMVIPFTVYADDFRILAAENGTQVFINCDAPILLNRGEYHDFSTSAPTRISSTLPITVGQFKRGQDCTSLGDANFLLHSPLGFISHKAVFQSMLSAIPGNQYGAHYVTVITRSTHVSYVTLDNAAVAFSPVPLNPNYSYARVTLTPGTHTLLSDSGFYAIAYGFGQHDSYTYQCGYDAYRSYNDGSLDIVYNDTLCVGEISGFTGTAPVGTSSWYWAFGDGATAGTQDPSHVYGAPGTYTVTLTATDGSGCPSLTQEPVTINYCFLNEDCEVFVPEAFSPNNDDLNDVACVYGACIGEMEFVIYDRWGEVVFRTNKQSECWDGTYQGTLLDNAVFAWTLNATLYSGTELSRAGNITLIR